MEAQAFDEGRVVDDRPKYKEEPDIVQMLQLHALRLDPVTLTIESDYKQLGWVCLDHGNVTRATTASGKSGFDAFVEIISWDNAHVSKLDRDSLDTPNLDLPLPRLLIEAFWEAQEHVCDEPPCDSIPEGLEEETVTGKSEYGPPDGVTKAVIETAQRLSLIKGFVAVSLIYAPTGDLIETLGDRTQLDLPAWVSAIVIAQRENPDLQQAVFTTSKYLDVLMSPIGDTEVSYFIRMDRATTNRGRLEIGLRQAREAHSR